MKILKEETGFTIMELTVSIIIMGVLASVTMGIIYFNAHSMNVVSNNTLARIELRSAMNRLRRDIQKMDSGSIVQADASHLYFIDIDGNLLRYRYNNGQLDRSDDGTTWTALLNNLTATPFVYRDTDLAVTVVLSEIRFVDVALNFHYEGENYIAGNRLYVRN